MGDVSDDWRSLFPVFSVFPAPLLQSTAAVISNSAADHRHGPLIFYPTSPPTPIFLSPSPLPPFLSFPPALPHIPFVHPFSNFLPTPLLQSPASPSIPFSNSLVGLCSASSSYLFLFFPCGPNANSLAFLSCPLPFHFWSHQNPALFTQTDGFVEQNQSILKLSVAPHPEDDFGWGHGDSDDKGSDVIVEGVLVASKLYSVSWFRIESRKLKKGEQQPFLVPLAKQGFSNVVVDTKGSPYFRNESVVLLENGELYWFDMDRKLGGKMDLLVAINSTLGFCGGDGGGDGVIWLGCDYGPQPSTVIAACSKLILLVDLRHPDASGCNVLARVDLLPGLFHVLPQRFYAFCKAEFDPFQIAVATEHFLLLCDMRHPEVPLLVWEHELNSPCFIAMFKLSDLRRDEEFKWASETGFAILVGSFSGDDFSFFCYGPQGDSAKADSRLCAWELPSSFSLSGRYSSCVDDLLKDLFSGSRVTNRSHKFLKKDSMLGFHILRNDLCASETGFRGFMLIRLLSSGKLEMQLYCASSNSENVSSFAEPPHKPQQAEAHFYSIGQEDCLAARYQCLSLHYLYGHMTSRLPDYIARQSKKSKASQINVSSHSKNLATDLQNLYIPSVSAAKRQICTPSTLLEVANGCMLPGFPLQLLSLTFSKNSDLFQSVTELALEFLRVPASLPDTGFYPFHMVKPSTWSEKQMTRGSDDNSLVGPILPIPFLVALVQNHGSMKSSLLQGGDQETDLLARYYDSLSSDITSTCDPENSGSSCPPNEKDCVVFDSRELVKRVNSTTDARNELRKEQQNQEQPSEDKKFCKFICGFVDKTIQHVSNESPELDALNLGPTYLDYDSTTIKIKPEQVKVLKFLKRNQTKWLKRSKTYLQFCTEYNISESV